MKPGTHIKLSDGRFGTVVYSSLDGYGIKWGKLDLTKEQIESIYQGNGNLTSSEIPEGFDLLPEAMLRESYPNSTLECVGEDYIIVHK